MATWFSASAVVSALAVAWLLDESGRAWLTMAAQIDFVVGALGSTLLNLADRAPAARLFAVSAVAISLGGLGSLLAGRWADQVGRTIISTALTLQTSLGFLLTLFIMRMVPLLSGWWGWGVCIPGSWVSGRYTGNGAFAALCRPPTN